VDLWASERDPRDDPAGPLALDLQCIAHARIVAGPRNVDF
jgi:hypothetical protein